MQYLDLSARFSFFPHYFFFHYAISFWVHLFFFKYIFQQFLNLCRSMLVFCFSLILNDDLARYRILDSSFSPQHFYYCIFPPAIYCQEIHYQSNYHSFTYFAFFSLGRFWDFFPSPLLFLNFLCYIWAQNFLHRTFLFCLVFTCSFGFGKLLAIIFSKIASLLCCLSFFSGTPVGFLVSASLSYSPFLTSLSYILRDLLNSFFQFTKYLSSYKQATSKLI